jgi:hypothetical protein
MYRAMLSPATLDRCATEPAETSAPVAGAAAKAAMAATTTYAAGRRPPILVRLIPVLSRFSRSLPAQYHQAEAKT